MINRMGYLSLIMGCMFAQKTTALLCRIRRFESIGYRVLVINHSKDERYGKNSIATHDLTTDLDGQKQSINRCTARCIDRLELADRVVRGGEYNVVIIDEAQFFGDLFDYVTAWADELDIHIIVAGLDGDCNRKPFGDILRLIPHAEEVERLSAFCSVCRNGTLAKFSKFIGSDNSGGTGQVLVGGSEVYKPVCRKHYINQMSI